VDVNEVVARVRKLLAHGDELGGFHADDDTGNMVDRGDLRALCDAVSGLQSAHADICERYTVALRENAELKESVERALAAHKVLTQQYTLALREVADQWKTERDALREAVEYVIECDDSKWVQYFKDELAAIDRGVSDAS
jgi:hypothetical protein